MRFPTTTPHRPSTTTTTATLSTLLFLPLIISSPIPSSNLKSRALTSSGSSVASSSAGYDFIIAGGGLSGSVLGRRLADALNGGFKVLVIEAGDDQEGNSGVYDASQYQSTFNTPLDWAYQTTTQQGGNQQTIRGGKMLGGSTGINGLAWSKPHDFQLDALETVGNQGVNWKSLEGYMLKTENFLPPSSSQVSAGLTYDTSSTCHAQGGPISIQYDSNASPAALERNFNSTIQNLGLRWATDLTCGNPEAAAPIANTRNGGTRIDAYRGYLWQRNLPNLTILTNAQVGRVILSSDSTPKATGVEFVDSTGSTYTVSANLEVILSTGSIKTPIILQHSGIGPAQVLSNAGVQQKIDLPVGQNLIDQTTVTTNWGFTGERGAGQPVLFPTFDNLVSGNDATNLRNILQNDLAAYAQDAVNNGAATNATALQVVLEIQRDWILNKNAAVSESFDYSYGTTLGYDSWFLLPFGRGSINITDSSPYSNNFAIDPRYFSNDFDRLAQAATVRLTRSISTGSPLSGSISGEQTPGGNVPNGADLNAWAQWSEGNYRSNWHPIGTVAMMSKALGGCVDSNYNLYGVSNLRVVDGSILPFQVSSHLMSVLYGLTERAAEIIIAAHSDGKSSDGGNGPNPPSNNGVAIHPNGDTSKCIAASSNSFADGTSVVIADCTGVASQKWQVSNGSTKVQLAGTNFCLDAGSNPGNGIKMKIWTCHDNLPAQQWYYTGDNHLAVQDQGVCLDLTDGSKANGNVLQTWSCSGSNASQLWTF